MLNTYSLVLELTPNTCIQYMNSSEYMYSSCIQAEFRTYSCIRAAPEYTSEYIEFRIPNTGTYSASLGSHSWEQREVRKYPRRPERTNECPLGSSMRKLTPFAYRNIFRHTPSATSPAHTHGREAIRLILRTPCERILSTRVGENEKEIALPA